MPCDFNQLPHLGIRTLAPYVPGKSIAELAREKGLQEIIKLGSNENPRGCSPHVLKAIQQLSNEQVSSYPIPSTHPLPQTLAKKLNIDQDMLTLSHGSDALFQLLIICFALHRQKHILTHDYAFQTYSILANIFGVPLISTPLLKNWQIDIEAMIKACNEDTALIFIANPNNPTGALLSEADILHLLNYIPSSTILVLDEAYDEFLLAKDKSNSLKLLKSFSNLVITRTFSKAYGLAGLRLGYSISDPNIHHLLQKIVLPFTINQAALVAGLAALEDDKFLSDSVALNHQELGRVRQELTQRGFECLPSFGNFVTVHCKIDGAIVYQALLNHGIIVRPLHPYKLDQYLRVSIGTTEQNTRFLDTLSQITSQLGIQS